MNTIFKKSFVFGLFLVVLTFFSQISSADMTKDITAGVEKLPLAQRSLTKQQMKKWNTVFKKKLAAPCGKDFNYEIHWETLIKAEDTEYANFESEFAKVYFEPMEAAFKDLCKNEETKKAMLAQIKTIVVKNEYSSTGSPQTSSEDWATYSNGVLTLNMSFRNTDAPGINGRALAMAKALTQGLK